MKTTMAKRKRLAHAFAHGVGYAFRISYGAAPRQFIKPLSFGAALRTDAASLAGDWNNVVGDLCAACDSFARQEGLER